MTTTTIFAHISDTIRAKIVYSTGFLTLPYREYFETVEEYQTSNEFDPIQDVGQNRFYIGTTSYFAPDCKEDDRYEICKGVPVSVYEWLLENGRQAKIEMTAWEIEDGPWDEEDAPASAFVCVNFEDDYHSAVAFKLKFEGVETEFPEGYELPDEAATVGYAGIVMKMMDGRVVGFRCPVKGDTPSSFAGMREAVDAALANDAEFQAMDDAARNVLYQTNAIQGLIQGMLQENIDFIGQGIEALHAILEQPQGFTVDLSQDSPDSGWIEGYKVWKNESYDQAKAAVDSYIDAAKQAA
jgi:hypothetical protein